jgi:predicted DNA-binding transcriptional regulator AlpA
MKPNSLKTDSSGRYLLPLQEVAQKLSISRETLYRRINQGLFPEPIKQGRLSFYALSDVESYLGKLKRTLS